MNERLQWNLESLALVVPELILTGGILGLLIFGFSFRRGSGSNTFIYGSLILVGFSLGMQILAWENLNAPVSLFNGLLQKDKFSAYFNLLFDISALLTFLMMHRAPSEKKFLQRSETAVLLLTLLLGAHLLAMSAHLVMVFVTIELISISAYVLTGISETRRGAEGSMKYFLFGAATAAVLLYGFSLVYGFTGSLQLTDYATFVSSSHRLPDLLLVGIGCSLAGFLFKVAATPFHLWAPDVYEAAPLPVVAFFSVVPKLAGIAALVRFIFPFQLNGYTLFDWQPVLAVVSLTTLLVGNFAAIRQTNPVRLMAYSSIAQTGFLLVGLVCFNWSGIHHLLFYASVYLVANFLIFITLQRLFSNGYSSISSFAGVGKNEALSMLYLLTGMISLAGIPPTGGFMGKLFVFSSLWTAYEQSGSSTLWWLLILGLLTTVVSLFYYLKIPFYAFFRQGSQPGLQTEKAPWNPILLLLVTLLIGLFLMPDFLMGLLNTINFVP